MFKLHKTEKEKITNEIRKSNKEIERAKMKITEFKEKEKSKPPSKRTRQLHLKEEGAITAFLLPKLFKLEDLERNLSNRERDKRFYERRLKDAV